MTSDIITYEKSTRTERNRYLRESAIDMVIERILDGKKFKAEKPYTICREQLKEKMWEIQLLIQAFQMCDR